MSGAGSLDIRVPALAGLAVLAGTLGGAWLAASRMPFAAGFTIVDVRLADRTVHAVPHVGGPIAKVLVGPGQRVAAGDLLATVEAGDLDARIATLKAQSRAAQLHLESVRREAHAFNAMLEQRLVSRGRVAALEDQVAALEREAAGVIARAQEAERLLERVEIRTPVAGTVRSVAGLVVGRAPKAGETVAEITPAPDRLVLEGRLTGPQARAAGPGTEVRVWPAALGSSALRPLTGKITWISPAAGTRDADGKTPRLARLELQTTAAAPGQLELAAGLPAVAVLATGRRSLLQQLLDPLRRVAGRPSSV